MSLSVRPIVLLTTVFVLAGCDFAWFKKTEGEQVFRDKVAELSQRVCQLRLDATELPGKEESAELVQLETTANQIAAQLASMQPHAEPLRKPQLELLIKHWTSTTRQLREYHLREQTYKTFLQQRATLSTQLAVFTDNIDKLAAMVVQARLPPDVIYRTTGMLYINERMQHSLSLLSDRSNDTPLLMERFSRDQLLLKSYLTDLRREFSKVNNRRQAKQLQDLLQVLQDEFIRNGPLMEEVMQTSRDFLDFIDRHNKLQEMFGQMADYLEQMKVPPQQAGV